MPGLSAASLAVVQVWGISKTREMHAPRQEATSGRIKVSQNLLRSVSFSDALLLGLANWKN